jgi:hypothetical protein
MVNNITNKAINNKDQFLPTDGSIDNGMLFLPITDFSVPPKIEPPLFLGGDIGSLMPLVEIEIPNLFISRILPMESIVKFEYTPFPIQDAVLSFIDPTPLFFESLARRMYQERKRDAGTFKINVKFGWRLGNELVPSIINNEKLEKSAWYDKKEQTYSCQTSFQPLKIIMDYVGTSSQITFHLREWPLALTESIRLSKAPEFRIESGKTFKDSLQNFVNENTDGKSDRKWKVELEPADLEGRLDLSDLKNVQLKEANLHTTLNSIIGKLSLKTISSGDARSSKISWHIGSFPEKESDSSDNSFYTIYIYEVHGKEKDRQNAKPFLQYPTTSNSILSFRPKILSGQDVLFLTNNIFVRRDIFGNLKNTTVSTNLVEGLYFSQFIDEETRSVGGDIPDDEVENQGRDVPILAEIDVEIMGEPALCNKDLFNLLVDVEVKTMVSEQLVLNQDDLFANFPQVPPLNTFLRLF